MASGGRWWTGMVSTISREDGDNMVDIGNVCEDCANAWSQVYLAVGEPIVYQIVECDDCEECEGESCQHSETE